MSPHRKQCTGCGELKPLDEFHRKCSTKDGRCSRCKTCTSKDSKEYRRQHPELMRQRSRDNYRRNPDTWRAYYYKQLYDLTLEEYDQILEAQGGGCAICGHRSGGQYLAVDHNHDTGKTRGLLCDRCNQVLGKVHEDPDLLRQLALYLEKHA